ncbi:MAG TPA: WecB/TagA/CpsF family glycosyltransferase [Syntrophorhabdales bacterium]|nr:WecB/TagA/CpsF family glycosyltransferase [Syntrophorhabdales bacterium]
MVKLLDFSISNLTLDQTVDTASNFLSGSRARYLACINPHSLVVSEGDSEFKEALRTADILIPDGFGIVLASRILGLPIRHRVSGPDFFLDFTKHANSLGPLKYFLLGSSERVIEKMVKRLKQEAPNIDVCGVLSPPYKEQFTESENEYMVHVINACRPDVLWVGLSAPKQEKWIFQIREKVDVPFVAAIGAGFDFYAGTKKRSSFFWQRAGLEWLPRFLREPRRLWSRNLKSTPIFLSWVAREKLRQIRGKDNIEH